MRKTVPKKASSLRPFSRGDLLAFRIPPNATDEELAFIESLRGQRQARNEPYLSALFWGHVRDRVRAREQLVTIPLPMPLTLAQQRLLGEEEVRRAFGYFLYQSLVGGNVFSAIEPTLSAPPESSERPPSLPRDPALQNLLKGIYQQ